MIEQHEQKTTMELSDLQRLCGITEDMEFDAPFSMFTWAHWLEMQTKMLLGFCRFQRAISDHQFQLAALIVLEMQQVVIDLQKEVCSWLEPAKKHEP